LRERLNDIPLLVKHFLGRDYFDSYLDQRRFPFALWCIDRAQHDSTISIRGLQNAIKDCVARSLEPRLKERQEMTRLRAAVEKATQKGKTLPITQAELARQTGVKPPTLHDEPWKSCVQELVDEGLIRATRNFVRKKG
jgi:transcriptional regulator with AAA-type ATPase domain